MQKSESDVRKSEGKKFVASYYILKQELLRGWGGSGGWVKASEGLGELG